MRRWVWARLWVWRQKEKGQERSLLSLCLAAPAEMKRCRGRVAGPRGSAVPGTGREVGRVSWVHKRPSRRGGTKASGKHSIPPPPAPPLPFAKCALSLLRQLAANLLPPSLRSQSIRSRDLASSLPLPKQRAATPCSSAAPALSPCPSPQQQCPLQRRQPTFAQAARSDSSLCCSSWCT